MHVFYHLQKHSLKIRYIFFLSLSYFWSTFNLFPLSFSLFPNRAFPPSKDYLQNLSISKSLNLALIFFFFWLYVYIVYLMIFMHYEKEIVFYVKLKKETSLPGKHCATSKVLCI